MRPSLRLSTTLLALPVACIAALAMHGAVRAAEEPAHPAALDDAIVQAAREHGVPEHLIRRVIMRESKYNAKARNHSFWGLMQISYPTAKSMGFKGTPKQLLDPFVNLKYAVPYLANAFVIAGKSEDAAVRLYAAGYYFTARSKGLLSSLRTAESDPMGPVPEPVLASNAVAQPPQSVGVFGALFGPGRTVQPEPQPQPATQTADAAQTPPAGAPVSAAAPAGTFNGPTTEMVAGKSGDLAPPKKWLHDGGMTTIARGEQGLDGMAARDGADAAAPTRSARRKSKKVTTFASLDVPSTAQAYANGQGADPRFATAPSQAAIAQATGAPAAAAAPVGAPAFQLASDQVDASRQPLPTSAVATASSEPATSDDKASKRKRHVARHKAKTAEPKTQQAMADRPVANAQ